MHRRLAYRLVFHRVLHRGSLQPRLIRVCHLSSYSSSSFVDEGPTRIEFEHRSVKRLERSEEAEKAARLLDQGALSSAQRILKMDPKEIQAQDFRETFRHLAGSRYRIISEASTYAEQLLDHLLQCPDPSVIESVLQSGEGPNSGLISLVELYLLPFRGTNQGHLIGDRRNLFVQDTETLLVALTKATKVVNTMTSLQTNPLYKTIVPDNLSCGMVLTLWTKRLIFLRDFGKPDEEMIGPTLDGAQSVQDCIVSIEALIDRMIADSDYPSPSADHYGLLITAHIQSGFEGSIEMAKELIHTKLEANEDFVLVEAPYNAVLYGMAREAESNEEYAAAARGFLNHMKANDRIPGPSVIAYSTLLLAMCNAGDTVKAGVLLDIMENDASGDMVQPNLICYNTVLKGWAHSSQVTAVEKAEQLLHKMVELSESGKNPQAGPDRVSFTSVIEAISNSNTEGSAERAEAILFSCTEHLEKCSSASPDTVMCNVVLGAWTKESERRQNVLDSIPDTEPAERAEALLRRMQEEGGIDPRIRPDNVSYNTVMHTWAKSGEHAQAAQKCRLLLEEMKNSGYPHLAPDVVSYNILLGTIVRGGQDGVREARDLFEEMRREGVEPDVATYNMFIDSLVQTKQRRAAERAEEILNEMESASKNGNKKLKPTSTTYNIVLNGYAKSSDPQAPAHAERILQRMLANCSTTEDPSLVIGYSAVMNAYAKSKSPESLGRALDLLHEMQESTMFRPNAITFNTVINALSRSNDPEAPMKAERLLNQMQEAYHAGDESLRPNAITSTSVMNCWARSGIEGGAARAEAILSMMEEASDRNPSAQPNVISYSTVINGWAKSGHEDGAANALRILNRMEQLYQQGKIDFVPNTICYNATINAIARSKLPDKGTRARALLDHMIKNYHEGNPSAKPDVSTFSTAINACAYCEGSIQYRKEMFLIARNTFREFIEGDYGKPSSVLFVNFITACSKLLPWGEKRTKLVQAIYRDCAERGLLNNKIKQLFEFAVSYPIKRKRQ